MTVYLDTETTGLHGGAGDQIVEIAIINDLGEVLINSLLKPTKLKKWPEAQKIHGITPESVAKAPTLKKLMPAILKAIKDETVVIYNANFDTKFFPAGTFDNSEVECCMERYAEHIGDWNDYHENYRWHKLIAAARHVGHVWSGDAHRALADTLATRSVWQFLEDQPPKPESKPEPVPVQTILVEQTYFDGDADDECPECGSDFIASNGSFYFCAECGYHFD